MPRGSAHPVHTLWCLSRPSTFRDDSFISEEITLQMHTLLQLLQPSFALGAASKSITPYCLRVGEHLSLTCAVLGKSLQDATFCPVAAWCFFLKHSFLKHTLYHPILTWFRGSSLCTKLLSYWVSSADYWGLPHHWQLINLLHLEPPSLRQIC